MDLQPENFLYHSFSSLNAVLNSASLRGIKTSKILAPRGTPLLGPPAICCNDSLFVKKQFL